MKEYKAPKMEFIKFNCKDIIQTSGLTLDPGTGSVGGDSSYLGLEEAPASTNFFGI